MRTEQMFATPMIVAEPFEDLAEVAELAGIIRQRAAAYPGVRHSNDGGWQSAAHDFLDWAGPLGAELLRRAAAICDRSTLSLADGQLIRAPLDWQITAWANVNGFGAANLEHVHPGAYWSGSFYADDGGIAGNEALGGALEFVDPRGPAPMMYAPAVKIGIEGCVTAGLGERHYPRTGELVLFPSWLRHSVTRYLGNGTRISVAFNFSL